MDEKLIRKYYGEKMWHFCRENFSTILETPNELYKLISSLFYQNHSLYDDLDRQCKLPAFVNYVYYEYKHKDEKLLDNLEIESPRELLKKAGYILYECKTKEDILSFKKYYVKNEELCTFRDDRLKKCHVFFAVKADVEHIRREVFKNPERQDLYGTSVISIQFSKDDSHTLSIKNRYNHTVANPDATFSNNLDNIIPGLTLSFEKYYGMKQKKINGFELYGYVLANDGKYYKSNLEINNLYFCPDNIIIDNSIIIDSFKDKSRFLVVDYFIIDLKYKKIIQYPFINGKDGLEIVEKDIKKINVTLDGENRVIEFIHDEGVSKLVLNKFNSIIKYINDFTVDIPGNFMNHCENLESIELSNAIRIDDFFLSHNRKLKDISLPKVEIIKEFFMYDNKSLKELYLPNAILIGERFLVNNNYIKSFIAPKVKEIGSDFMPDANDLEKIDLESVEKIGDYFLENNIKLKKISLPNVKIIGNSFMVYNKTLSYIYIPNAEIIGDKFLYNNDKIEELDLDKVKIIGESFLILNNSIKHLKMSNVETIKHYFLMSNRILEEEDIPKPTAYIGYGFLQRHKESRKYIEEKVYSNCKKIVRS